MRHRRCCQDYCQRCVSLLSLGVAIAIAISIELGCVAQGSLQTELACETGTAGGGTGSGDPEIPRNSENIALVGWSRETSKTPLRLCTCVLACVSACVAYVCVSVRACLPIWLHAYMATSYVLAQLHLYTSTHLPTHTLPVSTAYLPPCLPACPPACPPACLPAHQPTHVPA